LNNQLYSSKNSIIKKHWTKYCTLHRLWPRSWWVVFDNCYWCWQRR